MKVAVYLQDLPRNLGGGYTFQQNLLASIAAASGVHGHEFVVFTESAGIASEETALGLRVVHVSTTRAGRALRRAQALLNGLQDSLLRRRYYPLVSQFERLLVQEQIELVWFASQNYVECSAPYVFTIWDLQNLYQPWYPEVGAPAAWYPREQMLREAVQRAALVIVPNAQGEKELVQAYPATAGRIVQLPHPTPEFALAAGSAPRLSLPEELGIRKPYLFYPAQFWAHKNHVSLLRALRQLIAAGHDLNLVLVGSDKGNRAHVVQQVSALGLDGRVQILGFVEIETLLALYQNAACLTYVSSFGPENLPPLEAFALGCPVVAGDYAGAEEQLAGAALVVDRFDPTALAQAIERVLGDARLRDELVARGYERARAFTAKDYVAGLLAFIDRFVPARANWR